ERRPGEERALVAVLHLLLVLAHDAPDDLLVEAGAADAAAHLRLAGHDALGRPRVVAQGSQRRRRRHAVAPAAAARAVPEGFGRAPAEGVVAAAAAAGSAAGEVGAAAAVAVDELLAVHPVQRRLGLAEGALVAEEGGAELAAGDEAEDAGALRGLAGG